MTTSINQKEYLKKYLGIGKTSAEKKKKKKKEKLVGTGLKIVDDDADAIMAQQIQDDLAAENEDAPQIVAVIDERPISLQIDEHTNSSMWKPIGEPSSVISENHSLKVNSFTLNKQVKVKKEPVTETYSKHSNNEKAGASKIHIKQENRERSNSPLRRNEKSRNNSDSDISRKKNQYHSLSQKYKDCSPPRSETSDYSPPRRKRQSSLSPRSEKDMSPPRSKRDYSTKGSDNSLSKRKQRGDDQSPSRRERGDEDRSPPRRKREEDNSPPRRKSRKGSNSPKRNQERDISPLRRKNRLEDNSPKRRNKDMDNSPPRKKQRDDSPLRRGHREIRKKSRWSPEKSSDCTEKMGKTLDGKKAGLQNAKNLTKETKLLREKEDKMFKNLSAEVSGKNATTVFRNQKIKDMEEEAAKARREKEMKEKYDLWGKGLKQVEDRNHHIEEQLHEMSKPLARYADDEDLEKFLKEQERDGDPMLSYIRKKKKKEKVAAGVPEKPMYMGEFMPNRFGIQPGYRWDGVDRSNGYEKKWFEVQNSKRAKQEEAFKWSTEDM